MNRLGDGAWVDLEIQRMNLDYDLGTMQLDPAGMWIDNANELLTPLARSYHRTFSNSLPNRSPRFG